VTDSSNTLSKDDINVHLDGEEVREYQYRRTTGSLSFTPRKLSSGPHTVEITAGTAGSRNARKRKKWSFVVPWREWRSGYGANARATSASGSP
jgi:hypothetical protein